MATDYYAEAQKQVRDFARQLAGQRSKDYRYTSGVLDAIQGNLGNTLRASGQRLTAAQSRILGVMGDVLSQHGADAQAILGLGAQASRGGLGDYVNQAFDPAAASLAGGLLQDQAAVGAGAYGVDTAKDIVKLAQAGAKQAAAGAKYQEAQALQGRTSEDLKTIAAQQHDIVMAKLNEQLQEKMAAYQQDLANKAAAKAQAAGNYQMGQDAVNTARGLAQAAIEIHKAVLADPSKDTTTLVTDVEQALGWGPNNPLVTSGLLAQLVTEVRNGGTLLNAVNTVTRMRYGQVHAKYGAAWSKVAQTTLNQYWAANPDDPGAGQNDWSYLKGWARYGSDTINPVKNLTGQTFVDFFKAIFGSK